MNFFSIFAGLMVLVHLVAGWHRPRLPVIFSGILWAIYAVYEYLVTIRVLCDADCIRVDLFIFIPILALITFFAYQSYMGKPGQMKIIGVVLGLIGLLAFWTLADDHGYGVLANVTAVGALVIGVVYLIRSRAKASRP